MTCLLRPAATCGGLAASAFSTLSQAQDTAVVLPERIQLRRAIPVAAAPIVQQSPNGLYKLSVTDTGMTTGSASMRLDPAGSSLIGARVSLGGPGGKPVARLGDQINPSVSPPVILQGSPPVLAC